MSFRDRLNVLSRAAVGLFSETSATGARGLLMGITPGAVGYAPARNAQQFLQAYGQIPWLRAVTDKIATSFSSVQWKLYAVRKPASGEKARYRPEIQRASKAIRKSTIEDLRRLGELDELTRHPFYDMMASGNSFQTGAQMRKVTMVHYLILGEFFWLKERNGLGAPTAVWPVPPHWVISTPTPTRQSYRVGYRSWRDEVPDTEMFWFTDPNPENPYSRGVGIAQSLNDEYETDEFAAKTTRMWFQNSAKPELIISGKGISEGQAKKIETEWNARNKGFWNRFRTHILGGADLKITELDQDFRSQQFVQLRQFARDIALQTWGMPPEMMGILESCLDEETECLTRRGWLRQEALTGADEIATWNEEQGRLEYHRPRRILRFSHDGPMHYWTGRVNFACTPEHRLWVRHGRRRGERDGWQFASSAEVGSWTSARWRVTGGNYEGTQKTVTLPSWRHGLASRHLNPATPRWRRQPREHPAVTLDAHTLAPFLGYWLAEGWLDTEGKPGAGSVWYSQNAGPTAEAMRAAMVELDLGAVHERSRLCRMAPGSQRPSEKSHLEFRLCHRGLMEWLRQECGDSARTKRLPAEAFEWPLAAQRLLFDALIDGDGSRYPGKAVTTITYASASERLADDVQRLCVHLGLRAVKSFAGGIWNLIISEGFYQALDRYGTANHGGDFCSWLEVGHYTGTVWCVEIEHQRFFTRRGGRVVCHGNSNRATIESADFFYSHHLLEPRLEFFRGALQERLIPEWDERLIVDYESPVQEDRQAQLAAGTVAPWSLTVDDWRERQGLLPLEKDTGKVFLVPFNLIPTRDFVMPPPRLLAPPPGAPPAMPAEPAPKRLRPAPRRPIEAGWRALLRDDADVFAQAKDAEATRWAWKQMAGDPENLPELSRIAGRLEPSLRTSFLQAVAESQAAIDLEALASAVLRRQITDVEIEAQLVALASKLDGLTPILRHGFLAGAQVGVEGLGAAGIGLSFDLVSPHAVAWAERNTGELITGIMEEQRQMVASAVARGLETGQSAEQVAGAIQQYLGLTDRQAAAVQAFEARLFDAGVGADAAQIRVSRYAEALGRQRAQTVARTELITSSNAGQHAAWNEAKAQGLIDGTERKVWETAEDERVCPICMALDGEQVGLNEPFSAGIMFPPPHPQCRCSTSLVFA